MAGPPEPGCVGVQGAEGGSSRLSREPSLDEEIKAELPPELGHCGRKEAGGRCLENTG